MGCGKKCGKQTIQCFLCDTQYFIVTAVTLGSGCSGYMGAAVVVCPTETWKRCDAFSRNARDGRQLLELKMWELVWQWLRPELGLAKEDTSGY